VYVYIYMYMYVYVYVVYLLVWIIKCRFIGYSLSVS